MFPRPLLTARAAMRVLWTSPIRSTISVTNVSPAIELIFWSNTGEKGELLQPDQVVHEDVEFLEADLVGGVCVRGDRLAHDLRPMASQARLDELALQTQPVSNPRPNRADMNRACSVLA